MHWPTIKPDSSYFGAVGWCSTSEAMLEATEAHLLAGVMSLEPSALVNIGPVIDPAGDVIMTRRATRDTYEKNTAAAAAAGANSNNNNMEGNKDSTTTPSYNGSNNTNSNPFINSSSTGNNDSSSNSSKTPLLLLHGFGVGAGLWCMNIDALAMDRTVYVIDILGFGRSSRPTFSKDPYEVEDQFVKSLEAWRIVMAIDKFYLVGHSFGGYLSTLYAMKHPERVEHLLLVDPWGFPSRPPGYSLPFYAKPIEIGAACILPFFALRAAGPFGYLYLRLMPPFNTRNLHNIDNAEKTLTDYFYHLNVKNPSGERAFHCLMSGIAWAKLPMMDRLDRLKKEVPMTLLYGEKSWVWMSSGFKVQEMRADSYVDVQVVAGAGHAIGSEQPKIFNAIVGRVLRSVDGGTTPANCLANASVLTKDINGTVHLQQQEEEDQYSLATTDNKLYTNGTFASHHQRLCRKPKLNEAKKGDSKEVGMAHELLLNKRVMVMNGDDGDLCENYSNCSEEFITNTASFDSEEVLAESSVSNSSNLSLEESRDFSSTSDDSSLSHSTSQTSVASSLNTDAVTNHNAKNNPYKVRRQTSLREANRDATSNARLMRTLLYS